MPPFLTSASFGPTNFTFRGQLFLILIMLFLLPRFAVMIPSDPLVKTGGTLIVNCTLTNYTGQYDANYIYFKFGNKTIDSSYVHVLDSKTASLHLPNMTRSQSGIHCYCYIKDYSEVIGQQVVTVAGWYWFKYFIFTEYLIKVQTCSVM